MNKTFKAFLFVSLVSWTCIKGMDVLSPRSTRAIRHNIDAIKELLQGKTLGGDLRAQVLGIMSEEFPAPIHDEDLGFQGVNSSESFPDPILNTSPIVSANSPKATPRRTSSLSPEAVIRTPENILQPYSLRPRRVTPTVNAEVAISGELIDETIKAAIPQIIGFALQGRLALFNNKKAAIENLWARVQDKADMATFLRDTITNTALTRQRVSTSISQSLVAQKNGKFVITNTNEFSTPKVRTALKHARTSNNLINYMNQKYSAMNQ